MINIIFCEFFFRQNNLLFFFMGGSPNNNNLICFFIFLFIVGWSLGGRWVLVILVVAFIFIFYKIYIVNT